MWTAMVSVENWTPNVNDRATKIRWRSLKTSSRHKETCSERGRHPNLQSCSCRARLYLCALMILALRCHCLLCLKNLKLSKETSAISFHW